MNMKCPECGNELHGVSLVGLDDSTRCGQCGGSRIPGWVINKIAEGNELKITPIGRSAESSVPGKSVLCPEDGTPMNIANETELPPDVYVWQCSKCKWWWVPGDNIFDIKQAFEVKREYMRRWKKKNPITSFALPVVLTMLLTVGLSVGVLAIRDRVGVTSQAAGVSKVVVSYQDGGKAEVRFRTNGDVGVVAYKRESDAEWITATVVTQGDWRMIEVADVKMGEVIWLSFGQEVKRVTVGQKQ